MVRIPKLLEKMAEHNITPNVVTYSAILKGYCQENRLDEAFQLLSVMKLAEEFHPNEFAYNMFLDSCPGHGLSSVAWGSSQTFRRQACARATSPSRCW